MATTEEISKVIDRLHNEEFILINRHKNIRSAAVYGLQFMEYKELIIKEIKSLSVCHYISGPEIDDDPQKTGYIWKFMKNIYGK